MPEGESNNRIWEKLGELTGMVASNNRWLQIGIPIVVLAVGAVFIQNYNLNREVGAIEGLAEDHKELKLGIDRLEVGQEKLTRTVEAIANTVDVLSLALQTSNNPLIPPDLVLTRNDLVDSTPDWFVFDVTLPTESSPIEVRESSIMVNETVYNASWVRMDPDPAEMSMVPWSIKLGPINTDADQKQLSEALNNQGIPVVMNIQQRED